ncbi:MAG TPA: glycosyltransferase [Acidimicrobiales bacterium]|nr:glycosyltransferase [Acidimicrobiales bacterium]
MLPVNQLPYVGLERLGWSVTLVAPAAWSHEYRREPFDCRPHADLAGTYRPLPVALRGRPQRHFYTRSTRNELRRWRPEVLVIEEESFSAAALQWGVAARRERIPFAVQAAENLDRPLPALVRQSRSWVLANAALVVARSPRAAELARRWGAAGDVRVVPHHVPGWPEVDVRRGEAFRIGFAGRLVPEKGLDVLVEAVKLLDGGVELVVAGDGPQREWLEAQRFGGRLTLLRGLSHDDMGSAYARMDVLVLPSRSTPNWSEQFGRVLVEALSTGVPVLGSDSGEIPWVIDVTGGGFVFPEGDSRRLAGLLSRLRDDEGLRRELGERGKDRVRVQFSVPAVAATMHAALLPVCTN